MLDKNTYGKGQCFEWLANNIAKAKYPIPHKTSKFFDKTRIMIKHLSDVKDLKFKHYYFTLLYKDRLSILDQFIEKHNIGHKLETNLKSCLYACFSKHMKELK